MYIPRTYRIRAARDSYMLRNPTITYEAREAWRADTVTRLAYLSEYRRSLVTSTGVLCTRSPRGLFCPPQVSLARREASATRRVASILASWPSLVERLNHEIIQCLQGISAEEGHDLMDWDIYICQVLFVFHAHPHSRLGTTPFYLQ